MPDGGMRFGAPGYEKACPQKVHRVLGPRRTINGKMPRGPYRQDGRSTASKPFRAKPLHQLEDFLPHLK